MTQRNTDEKTSAGVGRRPPDLLNFICVNRCHLWIVFLFAYEIPGDAGGTTEGIHPQIAPILAEGSPGDPTRNPSVNRSRNGQNVPGSQRGSEDSPGSGGSSIPSSPKSTIGENGPSSWTYPRLTSGGGRSPP